MESRREIKNVEVGDIYVSEDNYYYIRAINVEDNIVRYSHAYLYQDDNDKREKIGKFYIGTSTRMVTINNWKIIAEEKLIFLTNLKGISVAKNTGIIETKKENMKYVKNYKDDSALNEGIIDFIRNLFTKILASFKNPTELKTKVDAIKQSVGTKYDNLTLDKVEIGKTIVLSMKSPDGKANDVIMLTKIAEGPKESILQLAGTTNNKFIETIGFNSNEEIAKGGVLFMIDNAGLGKDKAISLRIYTPLKKDGTVTVTKNLLEMAVPYEEMERANNSTSTAPSTGAL